jgi:uncharacterized protein (DUF433 family)
VEHLYLLLSCDTMKATLRKIWVMTLVPNGQAIIVRTEQGLTIAGTRITLYDAMDYLTAGYPAKLIREKLCLTDAQVNAAFSYIEAHQTEVEAEYQEVLQIAEDNLKHSVPNFKLGKAGDRDN